QDDYHRAGKDPHIWLDPVLAQNMVTTIADAFAVRDPANKDFYLKNAESFKVKLKDLDQRYAAGLASCKTRTIIYAGHSAFGYLARRYGLTQVSPYKGFSPDAEPSPKGIKAIIDTIHQLDARVIYYEELVDPKVARVIAEETGARMELLSAAHNVSKKDLSSATYLGIMETNLLKLKDGLRCQ
ncbi:MAG: zinc ABC transporter substrate-binding protein, partial [Candidatus Omnitrophica bacterium]|nr:zinc ABC transporter substrate-binding protein [Candidatus Omnitrophota bacterium]